MEKRWQNFESKDMSTFVDDVKELVAKQRSDVQRAFVGLHSPYIVRPEFQDHVQSCEVLDTTPEERGNIINSVKVVVDPVRYNQVINYHTTPMLPLGVFAEGEETGEESEGDSLPCMMQTTPSSCRDEEGQVLKPMPLKQPEKKADGGSVTECLENPLDTFTGKDTKALADKASKFQSGDAIRKGFDDDTYFVSTTTSQPHVVKRVPGSRDGAGYSCDKECLGFVSRKTCAHTVAVAHYSSNLKQFGIKEFDFEVKSQKDKSGEQKLFHEKKNHTADSEKLEIDELYFNTDRKLPARGEETENSQRSLTSEEDQMRENLIEMNHCEIHFQSQKKELEDVNLPKEKEKQGKSS
ncbi:hypothetical protein AWC38_SpisGene16050 [Stylophora pistillata]|uniref:Uncharacterized protein n=1 Tax=Stylophora pistillata TaxID=50429 RepID=A0A2B4RSK8_STYPI|nr:hypothetical protein AWC38_SpisGene16050 [Stylophora pistillata]